MSQRWDLPFVRFVADPGGETYLRRLGLFDPEERGGIALPGMLVIAPDGTEAYRYQGRDFADRTNDDDVYAALDALGLPAVDVPDAVPTADVPDDLRGFFRPKDFGPYFRGNMFGAIAIRGRLGDDPAAAIAKEHQVMAKRTLDAMESRRDG